MFDELVEKLRALNTTPSESKKITEGTRKPRSVSESQMEDAILGPKMKKMGKKGPGHGKPMDEPLEEDAPAPENNVDNKPDAADPDREDEGKPGSYDKKIYKVPFKIEDINAVYVGKPNRCMCGCSGKYTYASATKDAASKDRGYEVTDDEVDDKKVARVYNKMAKLAKNGVEVIQDYIYTVVSDTGTTQYTIYLNKGIVNDNEDFDEE